MATTPAGWYSDPWHSAPQRYWDGAQWTGHTGGASPVAKAQGRVYDARRGRIAMRLGQWAMGINAASAAANAVATLIVAIIVFSYTGSSANTSSLGATQGIALLGFLFVLSAGALVAFITAFVLRIIWAWRIAANGAALGIPARLAPGWAIGGWFIPFANVVLPYLSISGSVPRDRKVPVLRWWLFTIFASLTAVGLNIRIRTGDSASDVTLAKTLATVGVVFAVIYLGLNIAAAIYGIRLARQIHETHEEIAAERNTAASIGSPAWNSSLA